MRLTGYRTEAVTRRCAFVGKSDHEQGVAKLAKSHGGRAMGCPVVSDLKLLGHPRVRRLLGIMLRAP